MKTRILIAHNYGNAEVLEIVENELPTLPTGFARIQVEAAGINPIDARRMTGEFKHSPMPQAFGTEFSGKIIDLPEGTSVWAIGDKVLGSGGSFTHATVIDVPLGNLVAWPNSISPEVAGSLAGVSQTAMTLLDEIGNPRSLLIQGASGGVGSILIQLAREKGVQVVATASQANQEYLRSLGAIPVVYGPGLIDRLTAVHPELFDASVDMSGSEEATQAALATVKSHGIITTIAGVQPSSQRVRATWVKRNPANLKYVVDGLVDGRFSWNVSATWPFEQAQKAYATVLAGHTRGKVTLTF